MDSEYDIDQSGDGQIKKWKRDDSRKEAEVEDRGTGAGCTRASGGSKWRIDTAAFPTTFSALCRTSPHDKQASYYRKQEDK